MQSMSRPDNHAEAQKVELACVVATFVADLHVKRHSLQERKQKCIATAGQPVAVPRPSVTADQTVRFLRFGSIAALSVLASSHQYVPPGYCKVNGTVCRCARFGVEMTAREDCT